MIELFVILFMMLLSGLALTFGIYLLDFVLTLMALMLDLTVMLFKGCFYRIRSLFPKGTA